MQTIAQGYRGMSLLMRLNWDRFLMTAAMIAALYAGAYITLM